MNSRLHLANNSCAVKDTFKKMKIGYVDFRLNIVITFQRRILHKVVCFIFGYEGVVRIR